MASKKKGKKVQHSPKAKPGTKPGKKPSGKAWWHLDKNSLLWLLGVVAVTTVIYIPSINNDFTNWDDQYYVYQNPDIQSFSSKLLTENYGANWHPLTMYSLALNYQISEYDAWSYHLLNMVLHVLNTLLVFYFIFLLSKQRIEIAVIVSLIFGIHPMHVESVAWVAERKDVLYTFFFLLSMIYYWLYCRSKQVSSSILSIVFCALACLSKPAAVVLPVVLLLMDYFEKRPFDLMETLVKKLPYFAIAFGVGLKTLTVQDEFGATSTDTFSFVERILFASYGFMQYIFKMIVPVKLSTLYPYPPLSDIPVIFKIAPLLVIAVLGVAAWSMKKTRIVAFGVAFYVVTIALVLQLFVSVGDAVMADRYTYVPYIGLLLIAGFGFSQIWRGNFSAGMKNGLLAATALYCAFLGYQTFNRIGVWKNAETLWTDVIENYPEKTTGYYNRAHYFDSQGEQEKAIADYTSAIAIDPDYYEALTNRGRLYRLRGELQRSVNDLSLIHI